MKYARAGVGGLRPSCSKTTSPLSSTISSIASSACSSSWSISRRRGVCTGSSGADMRGRGAGKATLRACGFRLVQGEWYIRSPVRLSQAAADRGGNETAESGHQRACTMDRLKPWSILPASNQIRKRHLPTIADVISLGEHPRKEAPINPGQSASGGRTSSSVTCSHLVRALR